MLIPIYLLKDKMLKCKHVDFLKHLKLNNYSELPFPLRSDIQSFSAPTKIQTMDMKLPSALKNVESICTVLEQCYLKLALTEIKNLYHSVNNTLLSSWKACYEKANWTKACIYWWSLFRFGCSLVLLLWPSKAVHTSSPANQAALLQSSIHYFLTELLILFPHSWIKRECRKSNSLFLIRTIFFHLR